MSKQKQTHDRAFSTLIPTAGKADIHIHSTASDGKPTPAEILEYVEHRTDLDVIAITDHDTMEGAFEAKQLHEAGDYRFDLILGQEVTSQSGHILALYIDEPIPSELTATETVKRIHDQGGLAIAVHPLLILHYIDPDMLTADGVGVDVLLQEPFDAVEIINASPVMKRENRRARLLNRSIIFRAETGASDSHILEAIGKGYTLFPGSSAADFRRAIEQKTTEAVSKKYRVREILKYVRFYAKMKLRETGKRIFRLTSRKSRIES